MNALLAALTMTASAVQLPVVILDPGHGGTAHGAQGICGVSEKVLTLELAEDVRRLLVASRQAQVRLTRRSDSDVALSARTRFASAHGGTIFLSIHANAASDPHVRGVETFFAAEEPASQAIQALVQREEGGSHSPHPTLLDAILKSVHYTPIQSAGKRLATTLHDTLAQGRTRVLRGVSAAPFAVLRTAPMPAALVEVGFLTHPGECARLQTPDAKRDIARKLATGILMFLDDARWRAKRRGRGARAAASTEPGG